MSVCLTEELLMEVRGKMTCLEELMMDGHLSWARTRVCMFFWRSALASNTASALRQEEEQEERVEEGGRRERWSQRYRQGERVEEGREGGGGERGWRRRGERDRRTERVIET